MPVMKYCSWSEKPRSSSTTSIMAITVDADQRPQHRSGAARDAGAANQHGGDGRVVIAGAELHVARTVARGEQHSGHRRARTGNHVSESYGAGGAHPGSGRGAHIAADHHHDAADPRPRQDQLPDNDGGEEEQRHGRNAGHAPLEHVSAVAAGINALPACRERRATDQQRQSGDTDKDRISRKYPTKKPCAAVTTIPNASANKNAGKDTRRQAREKNQAPRPKPLRPAPAT